MNEYLNKKPLFNVKPNRWLPILALLILCSCTQHPMFWQEISKEQLAAEYIISNPDQYSEFAKLMELTKLTSTLNLRGPYTIFVPTNEAMFEYYREKNVSSLNDFSADFRRQLLLNHVFTRGDLNSGSFGLGTLWQTNAIDDYISTEFHSSDTYLNKTAKVIKHDIQVHNGYIHVIDKVLNPLTKDVYTTLKDDPAYRIFSEGLGLTGIKDTLQLISIPFGNYTARNRYTIYAVSDSVYNAFGIMNVNDMVKWTGANPDSLRSPNNPFYRYMEYHCISGTFYLNQFPTKNYENYPVLSAENNISMTLDNEDYKINLDPATNKYTQFIIPKCNLSAKNGVIHTVNGLLPVFTPRRQMITFETTDYPDLTQQNCYQTGYYKWYDGQNSFEKIKFGGEYLQYFYRNISGENVRGELHYDDCLSMAGYWWIEITTPKITKGRWMIESNIWHGALDFPVFEVYIDGIKVNEVDARIIIKESLITFGQVNWTKSSEHKIKLVSKYDGRLFWDYVEFTPISEK